MANSENGSCLSLEACSQKGTLVDLKGKLRRGVILFRNEQKKIRFVFVDVTEGGPLHQSGIRDGDELITVNKAELKSFHEISHIASAIRDCSSAIMLGMRRRSRRRRRLGSVPFVVLFQLGDEDANPVHTFCGFYWNVSPRDIPFIPSFCKCDDIVLEKGQRCESHHGAEVVTMEENEQYWLTYNGPTKPWTFEPKRSRTKSKYPCSTFRLEICPPKNLNGPQTVAFRPQNSPSKALEATSNNELRTSQFGFDKNGQFFNIEPQSANPIGQNSPVGIQSSLTNWYLGKDEAGKADLSPDVTTMYLLKT